MSIRVEHIGGATLHLGDAREIVPMLPDRSVDFIFTDPPYGHNNNNGDLIHRREAALGRLPSGVDTPLGRPIANDGIEANDLARWFFGEANRLLSAGGCCCCCCCGGGGPDPQFARWSLWLDEALGFKQMVVWDKGPMGMGWHYRRSYETVLVGEKPGGACHWYDTSGAVENVIRPGRVRKIIPAAHQHPTAKDPSLPLHFIRLHSQPGELVLDPFMGAGSTMQAALHSGRRFVGCEIELRWFDECCRLAERTARQDSFLKQAPQQAMLFDRATDGCSVTKAAPPNTESSPSDRLTPEEDAADSLGSYEAAIRAIGERVKAGGEIPKSMLSHKVIP